MTFKEIITEILIPLISGFIGGSIGNITVSKFKMSNKNAILNASGDIINGNKR